MRLGELLAQRVEPRDVLQHAGAVTEAEALLAAELLGPAPVLAGTQRLQGAVEPGQGLHQPGRAEGLGGQLHELLALLRGHRVEQSLCRSGPLGQRVDELVDVLRPLGEEVAVAVHEVGEVLRGVLATLVLLEQLVEVAQHRLDRCPVLVGRALEGLLHAREALVEHLTPEQVLDLLVVGAGLRGLPWVVLQLADGGRGRGREVVQAHLREVALQVVEVDVPGQLLALLEHGSVQQLADLAEGAVETVLLEQLTPQLVDLAGEVVQTRLTTAAAPEELAQRVLR